MRHNFRSWDDFAKACRLLGFTAVHTPLPWPWVAIDPSDESMVDKPIEDLLRRSTVMFQPFLGTFDFHLKKYRNSLANVTNITSVSRLLTAAYRNA